VKPVVLVLCILALVAFAAICIPPALADTRSPADGSEPSTAAIHIERTLTYQGILMDADGDPVADGAYQVTFRVYDAPTGGAPLWASSPLTANTLDGLFSLELGPIPLPFDTTYFLSLQIDDDIEMPDRQKLTMAPYSASADTSSFAFASADADTADYARHSLSADSSGQASHANLADSALFSSNAAHSMLSDSSDYSDIAGFSINADTAIYAWISLGYSHWSGVDSVLFTNGYWGIAKGGAANGLLGDSSQTMINLGVACTTGTAGQDYHSIALGGGLRNQARRNYATISGGLNNTVNAEKGAVGGGAVNLAGGEASVVGGGEYNSAQGNFSAIAGGQLNNTGQAHSAIGGGYDNDATAAASTVAGGNTNHATADYAFIGGGYQNNAAGMRSVVSGGANNYAAGYGAVVAGGVGATAAGEYSSVLSGYANISGDDNLDSASCVAGGFNNLATSKYAVISGGLNNQATGEWSIVAGGWQNQATAIEAVVGGGNQNTAGGATSVICGGQANSAPEEYSAICGGASNIASGIGSVVGGGVFNNASLNYTFIGGGWENQASGHQSFVGGGAFNSSEGQTAVVDGGSYNVASGLGSSVGGGSSSVAGGDYSCIPGGLADTTSSNASYSFIFGRGVYLNGNYRAAFFDGAYSGRLGVNRDDREGGILFPVHVGTSAFNGNGAYLTNGGIWTSTSSRALKENFLSLDGSDLLSRIAAIPVTSWNYKQSSEKHIGPMAEDFVAAFDVGIVRESDGMRDDLRLAASDVAGVTLAAVQELLKKVQALETRNAELERRISQLETAR
jgi:hypothetical protein